MPASYDAAPKSIIRFETVDFIVLGAFVWVILSVALGMKWERFLHWTGGALLVAGVLLAAKGISDVRRQWTDQPGIKKSAAMWLSSHETQCAEVFWGYWNRSIGRWPRLTKYFHLNQHVTFKWSSDSAIGTDAISNLTVAEPGTVQVTAGTAEERIALLEKRLAALADAHNAFRNEYIEDSRARRADLEQEAAQRVASDKRLDKRLSDAIGGGLRLQVGGVVCLLIGTVLTLIW